MAGSKTLISAAELLALANGRRVELVRGELVDMPPIGFLHFRVSGTLIIWIGTFVRERELGVAGPELGFVLARNPDTVRAPDVAFIRSDRILHRDSRGFFEGPPDLAVEVLSPSETASEVQQKVREYLAAGTPLVWVVDPQTELVTVYYPNGMARVHGGDELVSGEDVLPGFSFRPVDLFRT